MCVAVPSGPQHWGACRYNPSPQIRPSCQQLIMDTWVSRKQCKVPFDSASQQQVTPGLCAIGLELLGAQGSLLPTFLVLPFCHCLLCQSCGEVFLFLMVLSLPDGCVSHGSLQGVGSSEAGEWMLSLRDLGEAACEWSPAPGSILVI